MKETELIGAGRKGMKGMEVREGREGRKGKKKKKRKEKREGGVQNLSWITGRLWRWEMQEEGQEKTMRCAPLRHIGSLWKIQIEISRRQLYESGAQKRNLY